MAALNRNFITAANTDLVVKGIAAALADAIDATNAGLVSAATAPALTAVTNATAAPSTVRAVTGAMVTGVSLTAPANLVGVRGSVTISDGTTAGSNTFLYGTQGKLIGGTGTISAGSGHIAGVYAQLDFTGTTTNSGHVAAIIADIFAVGTGGANIDNIYAEQTTGTKNNAVLKAIVNSTYLFDLDDSGGGWLVATNGSTAAGCMKIKTPAGDRYIQLVSSPT